MGGFAFTLRWLAPWQAALLALTALLFNTFALHRLTRRALLRDGERAAGFSLGILLYPAAVLGLIVVFHRRLELAAATWGLLAFGDGMATVAGVLLGGPRLPWNRDKSWAGFVAFVLYGTVFAALLIPWTQRAVLEDGAVDWVGLSFWGEGPLFLLAACLAAALAAAFAESLRTGLDDNLLVPLVGGAVLYATSLVEPARLAAAEGPGAAFLLGAGINAILAVAAYASRGVNRSGAVWGWVLGTALFGLGGWRGFLMLLLFFALGTVTTKIGYARKAELDIAQEQGGRRGARNAFANVSAGVAFAFLALATPYTELFTVALVAAFATATCDTVSSEIGQAYGRRHVLITTFRRVPAGTDGAVSLEGTVAGILGAAVLGVAAWSIGSIPPVGVPVVILAAFVGATAESYLGATVERLELIDNELINFTNTVVGGLVACAGLLLIGR
jgi:uncharacterized protein (TIGR00297 family)